MTTTIEDVLKKGADQLKVRQYETITGKQYLVPDITGSTNTRSGTTQTEAPPKALETSAKRQVPPPIPNARGFKMLIGHKTLPDGAIFARMKLRGEVYYAYHPILLMCVAKKQFGVSGPHIEAFYGDWSESPVGRNAMLDKDD